MEELKIDYELQNEVRALFQLQEQNIEKAARALKVIAHGERLKILCVLTRGEQTVQNLIVYTDIAQARLSQHLSVLRDRNVLHCRRDGNFSWYRIADPKIGLLFETIRDVFCDVNKE
jgi:ArsR family transcriptional regulator